MRRQVSYSGRLYYDGGCGFCSQWVGFWASTIRHAGYNIVPQPAIEDLQLRFDDGRQLTGAAVYLHIMSRIWWLWPVAFLFSLPGLRCLFAAGYGLFKRHRYFVSEVCGMRPEFIKHYSEIEDPDNYTYPGSDEKLTIRASFGKRAGFQRLGIHHETLPPGRRTSYPHAESTEEEFVYVIEGHPDAWINGELFRLNPGDGVSFVPGTGIVHTILNSTNDNVRLLVAGEKRADDQVYYPLNPERQAQIGKQWWDDCPRLPLGPHNGLPNK